MSCCGQADPCPVPVYQCACQQECFEAQVQAARGKASSGPGDPGTPGQPFNQAEYDACQAKCAESSIVPAPPMLDDWLRVNGYGPSTITVLDGPKDYTAAVNQCGTIYGQAAEKAAQAYFDCLDAGGSVDMCFAEEQASILAAANIQIDCEYQAVAKNEKGLKHWFKQTNGRQTTCAQGGNGNGAEQIENPPPNDPQHPNPNPLPQCLLNAGTAYVEAAWPPGLQAAQASSACAKAYANCISSRGVFGAQDDHCERAAWACSLAAQADYLNGLIAPGVERAKAEGACVGDWLLLDVLKLQPAPYRKGPVCLGDYWARLKTLDRVAGQKQRKCAADLRTCFAGCPPNEIGTLPYPANHYFCGSLCNLAAIDCAQKIEREERIEFRHQECRREFPRAPHFKTGDAKVDPGPFGHGRAICLAEVKSAIDECTDRQARTAVECFFHCCGDPDCIDDCATRTAFQPDTTGCAKDLQGCLKGCKQTGMDGLAKCVQDCAKGFLHCQRAAGGDDHVCGADFADGLGACHEALYPDCPDCAADAGGTSNDLLGLPAFYSYDRTAPALGVTGCD